MDKIVIDYENGAQLGGLPKISRPYNFFNIDFQKKCQLLEVNFGKFPIDLRNRRKKIDKPF